LGGIGLPRQTFLVGSGVEPGVPGSYGLYDIAVGELLTVGSLLRVNPPFAESAIARFVLLAGEFQYNTKKLAEDEFGKVIVDPAGGGLGPQLKRFSCPEKSGMISPDGRLIVRISVAIAVLGGQTAAGLVAVIVMGNVPMAVGVPEISPVVWFTVKPPGKPVASNSVGLLSAVIW
jgi:hypothetical protein